MEKLLSSKQPQETAVKLCFEKNRKKLLFILTGDFSCPPKEKSFCLFFFSLFPSTKNTIPTQFPWIWWYCVVASQRQIWTCALNNLALADRSRQVVFVCLLLCKEEWVWVLRLVWAAPYSSGRPSLSCPTHMLQVVFGNLTGLIQTVCFYAVCKHTFYAFKE